MALPPGHSDGAPEPEPEPRDRSASGPTDEEVDRRFAELTAGFESPLPPSATASGSTSAPTTTPGTVGGPRDYAVADVPEDGFEPSDPEPLSSADPVLVLAWIGAIGGPIAFILLLILWQSAPAIVWLTALTALLAGWTVVIWRLPRSRNRSDDDDGAVL